MGYLSVRHKTLATNVKSLASRKSYLTHRQFVASQRACLVARDQRTASQALHSGQPANDHAAAGHASGSNGQGHRQGDGQSFRDRRNSQGDCEKKHVVRAVVMKHNADHSDDAGRDQDGRCNDVCETFQAFQEGWLSARCADHIQRQSAYMRGRTRCHNHALCASADDDRAGKGHILTIANSCRLRPGPGRVLGNRQRFARQERLVNFQPMS